MDGSFRLRAFTLTLFLVFLILAAIDPKFCYGNSEVHCIQSEQQALLRFKQDLTDPLNRLASWAGDGDCCQWVGVVCNNVTGQVQELNLRSFPPPELEYFSIEAQYEAAIQSYAQTMFGAEPGFGSIGNCEGKFFKILSEKKLSKAFVLKGTQPGPWTKTTMKKPGLSTAKAEKFKLGSLTTVLSVKEVQS